MRTRTIHMCGGLIAAATLSSALLRAASAVAQQSTADTTPVTAPYRAPQLALAEPSTGGTLPQDKPSVVFRFAQGEGDDPLDLASFVITVDGETRTAQFHVDSTEAWGTIDPAASGTSAYAGEALALGVHQLIARICSTRGICSDVRAAVTVVASALSAAEDEQATNNTSRWLSALVLLFALARKLFGF